MTEDHPTLLAVAHGTRDPAGAATVRALLDRTRALRPWIDVAEAYAEIAEPSLEDAVTRITSPIVTVPLMLARGYHALVDIPNRVGNALTTRPLGPDPMIAAAQAGRLAEALNGERLGPHDTVILGAAGSSDPNGVADVRTAARLLSGRLRREVPYGFVAAEGPQLSEVVAAHSHNRVIVASYLLAPGLFHTRMLSSGADMVSDPLGAHDAIARLILRRFDEARLRDGLRVA
ncbi:sirohydrochlorin chelatase [Actinomadura barringtoniae]|uniref:Sirohydrochlorin chelatase n=1 Tax=Actinomadura barringtoniae TaxID=1427535 RepID=A0A939TF74_9ACTN|nr:sirohydrochlorin chelatase [Actinomadura barringtoniae]MBO2454075.1 sirohydrochlorin chelatase [Actinomadura barringtoniae]